MKRLALIFVFALFAARIAEAADIPVVYTLDAKQLKLAVAGTNVTSEPA